MTLRVVPATLQDVGALTSMGQRFHERSGLPVPFSAPQASTYARMCVENWDGYAQLARDGEDPCGMILGWTSWHPFLPIQIAEETAWWVAPGAPRQAAPDLLRSFEDWAWERGCKLIALSDLALRDRPWLRRRGWSPVETRWIKVVD
ncbi:MAG: GNAT family N-acetyltransferase [Pseudomonadota bacterium]